MENHNVSTSNILFENLDGDVLTTVTLSIPSRDIGKENKDSAPTTSCDNQVPSVTKLTDLNRLCWINSF